MAPSDTSAGTEEVEVLVPENATKLLLQFEMGNGKRKKTTSGESNENQEQIVEEFCEYSDLLDNPEEIERELASIKTRLAISRQNLRWLKEDREKEHPISITTRNKIRDAETKIDNLKSAQDYLLLALRKIDIKSARQAKQNP